MLWRTFSALPPAIVLVWGLIGAGAGVAQQVAGSLEAGLQTLAQDLIASAPIEQRPPLSVLPFPGADQSCPVLSVFVVDELTTTFITAVQPRPRVVERQQLEALIAQNQLDEFLTDPEQRQRLGSLSGIGGVVLGTFAPIGDRLRINARMVAIDTGETIGAASVSVPRTREMEDLIRQSSGRGANCLPGGGRSGGAPRVSAGARAPTPSAAAPRGQGDNCTEDGVLNACPVSVSFDQNNRAVSLVLRIANTGQTPIAIALIGPEPTLVGNDGGSPSFDADRYSGTARCSSLSASDLRRCLTNARYLSPTAYTRIPPQGAANALFRFSGDLSPDSGASFSAVFVVRSADAQSRGDNRAQQTDPPQTFNVSLSDLRISQGRR